jgi:hypothetical protein
LTELALNNFGRGMNLKELPEQIGDNELQEAQNFLLTPAGQLEPRLGYASVNLTGGTPDAKTVRGCYIYLKPDGTEVKVIRAGDQLYYLSVDTWTELKKYSTYDFTTTASGTTASFTHSHVPLYGDASNWTLWNVTTATPVLAAHSAVTTTTTATVTADGGSGVGGTVTLASGAVSLTTLSTATSYQARYYSYAFDTGGDRTSFANHNGNLYAADGFNFLKLNGTTLTDVNVNSNDYALPYYLCSHDNRLYAGNLKLKIDGTNYTDYKRSITWSGIRDDTRWTPPNDTNISRIDLDFDVTGFVSFGHLLIFTSQAVYYALDDASLLGNYYFPSIKMQSRIGAVPFSMCLCDSDVWFANESGVWAVSKTDKFGDLEKNRLSYKVDPVFGSGLYTTGTMCAVYLPWRDEYWLSYQTAAATWKVLVGKRSLYDEWGRPPWMRLTLSSRDWCVALKTQDVFFTPAVGTYYLWKYYGRSDNGAVIVFKAQTKTFGGQDRTRKRLEWVTVGRERWGTMTATESATLNVKENNADAPVKTITPSYPAISSSVSAWSTVSTTTAWGSFTWNAPTSETQAINPEKYRVSKYVRKFSYLWEYSSSTSGAAPVFLNTQIWESKR